MELVTSTDPHIGKRLNAFGITKTETDSKTGISITYHANNQQGPMIYSKTEFIPLNLLRCKVIESTVSAKINPTLEIITSVKWRFITNF